MQYCVFEYECFTYRSTGAADLLACLVRFAGSAGKIRCDGTCIGAGIQNKKPGGCAIDPCRQQQKVSEVKDLSVRLPIVSG